MKCRRANFKSFRSWKHLTYGCPTSANRRFKVPLRCTQIHEPKPSLAKVHELLKPSRRYVTFSDLNLGVTKMKRIYEVVLKVFATYLFLRFIIFFFSAIGVLVAVTGQPYGEAYSAN